MTKKQTRNARARRRRREILSALENIVDAIWTNGLENHDGIKQALEEAEHQIDVSSGFVFNDYTDTVE